MSGCNKIRFASRSEAKQYARTMKAKGNGRATYPYRCEACGDFHLSSMNRRQARARGYRYR